jgi:hypothetical protein
MNILHKYRLYTTIKNVTDITNIQKIIQSGATVVPI